MKHATYSKRAAADHDDDQDDAFVQRTVPASATRAPSTTGASSVFNTGRNALKAARVPLIAAHEIVIRKNVPKPPIFNGNGATYVNALARMQPGDSVELPIKQARGFYATAKKFAVAATPPQKFSMRTIGPSTGAIWRDA